MCKLENVMWVYVPQVKHKTIVVLLQLVLLYTMFLPFPDFGQSHLKCILLPFHLRVTNENSLLNVLSVRQECSFFRDYPKPVFQATASGSVNQPCSDMACSPLNQHRRTI